jgi:hypothetical protein
VCMCVCECVLVSVYVREYVCAVYDNNQNGSVVKKSRIRSVERTRDEKRREEVGKVKKREEERRQVQALTMARMQHTISCITMTIAATHMDHFMLNLFFLKFADAREPTATRESRIST